MTNSDSGGELAAEIAVTLADEYGWSGPRPSERAPVDLPVAAREAYVGAYVARGGEIEFSVRLEGRGLELSWEGGTALLWPLDDSTFFDTDDGREVRFSRSDGEMALILGGLTAIRGGADGAGR